MVHISLRSGLAGAPDRPVALEDTQSTRAGWLLGCLIDSRLEGSQSTLYQDWLVLGLSVVQHLFTGPRHSMPSGSEAAKDVSRLREGKDSPQRDPQLPVGSEESGPALGHL